MATDISSKPKSNIFRSTRWNEDHSRAKNKNKIQAETVKISKVFESACSCSAAKDSYETHLQAKYQKAIKAFEDSGLLFDTTVIDVKASPEVSNYRCHAKLAVRPAKDSLGAPAGKRFAIGLFKPDSHTLVHHIECPLHRDSINTLMPALYEELEASVLQPYNEETHTGDLRYLAVRASHHTDELMVTFVTTHERHRIALKAMVLRLRQKGLNIVSAHINVNPEETNTIFGTTTKKLVGANGLRESLCGIIFEIGPTSFFQINPWQAEAIYRRVEWLAGHASSGDVAWDLYCGTGQISLLLAQLGYRTLGIEENPQAIEDAIANVARNQMKDTSPDYIASRVEDLIGRLPTWSERPSLMVANPSRRGLAAPARQLIEEGLKASPKSRLVYVSCEAETMMRDLKALSESGQLRQLECFDMFPYTDKLEWIAIVQ
ncbi:MAG: 23S rRNA (uracil(1939)-C(5))-methyltransferase RlmD [Bdellovibrionota bacterium]|nr:MAG: 23S rRNA (uracil(1939)-C(5))-methyltransferase RlmD [Pseudomonadota bacterium]